MSVPKCFISYSWDNEPHEKWVLMLAEQLCENGVDVLLDKWDLHPGADAPHYMETSVRESDFVILVCTPNFANKANSGVGGVGYEKSIVTGEVFQGNASPGKFVPIIREGDKTISVPSYLKSKIFIDFRNDDEFDIKLEKLLRHLHNLPEHPRPSIGPKPRLNQQNTRSTQNTPFMFCTSCGVRAPPESNECLGLYANHNFVKGSGAIFCTNCGEEPGQSVECSGMYAHHNFASGTGEIRCKTCGQKPGQSVECSGMYAHHNFISV